MEPIIKLLKNTSEYYKLSVSQVVKTADVRTMRSESYLYKNHILSLICFK